MTIEELIDRIEDIKSVLEKADDPHGIEGVVDELSILLGSSANPGGTVVPFPLIKAGPGPLNFIG